ncbi:MAG: undecaprenyl-diphosphate phosphatase [Pseudomonadota bacterium]
MSLFHLVLVAVIQGVTEFLPVSSSGHLVLLPQIAGFEDQGQVIDVAVHVGALFAVILYFWSDCLRILNGIGSILRGRFGGKDARLALFLSLATVPVVFAGLVMNRTGLDDAVRSTAVIGWTFVIFGIALYLADRFGSEIKESGDWSAKDAFIMGLWQVLSLIPGTSRSGITITGARQLGYERSEAARLAMLMSIPTIIASGVLVGSEVMVEADMAAARDGAIAAILAFIAALGALWAMMRLLKHVSFTPYVIYRVILGLIILWVAYS